MGLAAQVDGLERLEEPVPRARPRLRSGGPGEAGRPEQAIRPEHFTAVLRRAGRARRPDLRRPAGAIQAVQQAFQETGFDAGPIGGHTPDERPLIEVDEPDVGIGNRPRLGVYYAGVVYCGVIARPDTVLGFVVFVSRGDFNRAGRVGDRRWRLPPLLALLSLGDGRFRPPILLNPLQGLLQRFREGSLAVSPLDPLDPLQQAPVVDGQQMRDVLRRRPVPEWGQELVEQIVR